jgi:hypothetical protein
MKNEIFMNVTLTPTEAKKIIIEYLEGMFPDKKVKSFGFDVDGVEDPSDTFSEQPLNYELTKISATMVPRE